MKNYGKIYQREKAMSLLNEIVDTAEDLTPRKTIDEEYKIKGSLFNEIYNFLTNNDLKNEGLDN